jgi:hypothetical protein
VGSFVFGLLLGSVEEEEEGGTRGLCALLSTVTLSLPLLRVLTATAAVAGTAVAVTAAGTAVAGTVTAVTAVTAATATPAVALAL